MTVSAVSSLGKVLPNTNILHFSNSDGDFSDDEKLKKDFVKKVLIIPFENNFNSTIGLLPEHKVLTIEKLNSDEDDDENNKSYDMKKKEKPLHSVSHEGSIGKHFLILLRY